MTEEITGDYVLQMAERIERNGADFYRLAAQRAPGAAIAMLHALGAQEAQHEKDFHEMRGRLALAKSPPIDMQGEASNFIRGLAEGKFFNATADPAAFFTGKESFRDILWRAIGLEKESIVFYEAIKAVLAGKKDLEVVDLIIHAELGHIEKLVEQLKMLEK